MTGCPACQSAAVATTSQQWSVATERYELATCRACGSAFTAPLPTDETLKRFYATAFDYRWYRDHYAAKLRDSRQRVKEYRPLLGRCVLDFGGGLGYFSAAAREAGLESVTFDPYANRAEPARARWDSVVALHVIEHSNDPGHTLEQIKARLVPGGRLILAVPNYASAGYAAQGMDWVWAQPPLMHVFHFTAAGLSALLSRHGFVDLGVSYHERWDANLYCDVEHAERFRRWDAAWGQRYINRIAPLRRLVAARNSRRRFEGLERALKNYDPADARYAELQIVATAPGSPAS